MAFNGYKLNPTIQQSHTSMLCLTFQFDRGVPGFLHVQCVDADYWLPHFSICLLKLQFCWNKNSRSVIFNLPAASNTVESHMCLRNRRNCIILKKCSAPLRTGLKHKLHSSVQSPFSLLVLLDKTYQLHVLVWFNTYKPYCTHVSE